DPVPVFRLPRAKHPLYIPVLRGAVGLGQYGAFSAAQVTCEPSAMRLLVTGASGPLGVYLLREWAGGRWGVILWRAPRTGELLGRVKGNYREEDPPAPLSIYGQTKADAERLVLSYDRSVVVRLSLLFGPSLIGREAFFDQQLAALRQHRPVTLFEDEWRTPLD